MSEYPTTHTTAQRASWRLAWHDAWNATVNAGRALYGERLPYCSGPTAVGWRSRDHRVCQAFAGLMLATLREHGLTVATMTEADLRADLAESEVLLGLLPASEGAMPEPMPSWPARALGWLLGWR